MTFTPREREAMRLICDTFAPGDGAGVPSASEAGSVDLTLEVAAANPRRADVRQLRFLLRAWDTRALALAVTGRSRRFSSLDQAGREQFLLALSDSGTGAKRALFSALKGAALLPYYLRGGPALWEPMGYSGPLGRRDDVPPPALTPRRATTDTDLTCDVVVVGSGAGGGTAAGVLAAAGLDVVVLEAGDYHDERHFDGGEETGFLNLYALAPQATAEGQIALLAGRGLGGGTVVNYTTSFRTPDHVRQEWADLGTKQFATEEYDAALDAVCSRLGRQHRPRPGGASRRDPRARRHAPSAGTSRRCRATCSAATRASSAVGAAWAAGSAPSSRSPRPGSSTPPMRAPGSTPASPCAA